MSVKRIKNLVKQLNEYRHAYYNQDAPLVSDAEYDRLFDELKELEEQTGFILSNSPTQTVGYYPVSELAKVTHPIPLLSLEKTKLISELLDFMKGQIYQHIYEEAESEVNNRIYGLIKNLRKKIEENPETPHYIETIRGVGYRFRA